MEVTAALVRRVRFDFMSLPRWGPSFWSLLCFSVDLALHHPDGDAVQLPHRDHRYFAALRRLVAGVATQPEVPLSSLGDRDRHFIVSGHGPYPFCTVYLVR